MFIKEVFLRRLPEDGCIVTRVVPSGKRKFAGKTAGGFRRIKDLHRFGVKAFRAWDLAFEAVPCPQTSKNLYPAK
jgi:hypothetical protein